MTDIAFQPETLFASLGGGLFDIVAAADFPRHILRYRNQRWAARVGLGGLDDDAWCRHFAAFSPLAGSFTRPLALRYHGHQFRVYNPDIGDGRGFLFAQLRDGVDRRLLDLGTKGSGQTPYSRFGDGRLTLKGGVREVLATEMLEARGVNTSKSFSLIETGEALQRNDEPSPTRSAVLVRLSHSHVRYGAFQRLAYHQQHDDMAALVDYALHHLLDAAPAPGAALADRVARFMDIVVANAAMLAASYMAAGFVHGVLNTDNINVTGESFDYGPYRFAPAYDLGFTAAYFDHGGLYAFGRQAEALHWNLYQLAKALLSIVDKDALVPALETFPGRFEAALVVRLLGRLGLKPAADPQDNLALMQAMEQGLTESQMDLDQFYHDWYGGAASQERALSGPAADIYQRPAFADFRAIIDGFAPAPAAAERLQHRYFRQARPSSLLIDEIEAIWSAIDAADDWQPFKAKIAEIQAMGAVFGRGP